MTKNGPVVEKRNLVIKATLQLAAYLQTMKVVDLLSGIRYCGCEIIFSLILQKVEHRMMRNASATLLVHLRDLQCSLNHFPVVAHSNRKMFIRAFLVMIQHNSKSVFLSSIRQCT